MKSYITYTKLKTESRGGRGREIKDDLSILMGIQSKGSMKAKGNNKSSSIPVTISSIPKQQNQSARLPNRRALIFPARESSIKISQPAVRPAPGPVASHSHADEEMNSLRVTSPALSPPPSHNYNYQRTTFNGFEEGRIPDKSFLDRIQPPPPIICDGTQTVEPVNLINTIPYKKGSRGLKDRGEVLIQTPWVSRRTKLANLPNPDVTSRYAIKDLLEMMCGEKPIDDNIFTKSKPKPTYTKNNTTSSSSTATRTGQNIFNNLLTMSTASASTNITLPPHGKFDEIYDEKDLFQLNDGDQNEMDVDDTVDENQNLLKPYTLF